jgi:TfoX/Sxy family transcriptional regulator of competence genes
VYAPAKGSRMNPAWREPDTHLVEVLDATIAGLDFDAPIDFRPMFGCPAYFTGGNMFAGVWQDTVMLRLPEDQRLLAHAAGAGPFEPMPGRPMKEYVALPASMVEDPAKAAEWVGRAAAYAASRPPKAPKPKKPRAQK